MTRVRRHAAALVRSHPVALIGSAALAMAAAPSFAFGQAEGAALFAQNCSACHQLTGKGIPGAFPALAGDVLVNGPPQDMASVVVHGRGGMPAFGPDLSDQDIAAITSYVRSAWGNHGGPIDGAMVKAVRTGGEPPADKSAMQAH